MRFNPDIWKDIAQLTNNYTSYSITNTVMMQSTYSMRVYEIILSYDSRAEIIPITMGWFLNL